MNLIYMMPKVPPVDNFRLVGSSEVRLPKFPMDLYQCADCGHAQLLDVVDPNILYGNYIYTSSSSTDLDHHFSNYAEHVSEYFGLTSDALVLDVGSNDGLLLSKFRALGFKVLGVDASSYVAARAAERGIETEVGFFEARMARYLLNTRGRFDLVTANNVFSHADELREFACCIRSVLKPEGAFVFEVSYLKDLVVNKVIDYVYHEHLCHHSILPLRRFMASCGLKLIDVEAVGTKGGSIRCYAVRAENPRAPMPVLEAMIADEKAIGLYDPATFDKLAASMNGVKTEVHAAIKTLLAKGGQMAGYGAAATSTVLTAMLEVDPHLSFIIDDNPLRHNRLSPGYLLPVLGSDSLLREKPAVVFLSAWRFAKEIIARNQAYLDAGGVFLVPLPQMEIIRK
jgi:SAM-dependent methyltransferase